MSFPSTASEVLAAMITPAVLISASGTLVLSTSNRLSRVVDRVRVLAAEADRLKAGTSPANSDPQARLQLISEQLPRLSYLQKAVAGQNGQSRG